jgi:hypothetical protein
MCGHETTASSVLLIANPRQAPVARTGVTVLFSFVVETSSAASALREVGNVGARRRGE